MNNLLMILDGFGANKNAEGNAIAQANTPYLKELFGSCPHTLIDASGLAVGLPEGQMGNSEVGHLNIGAGRVVYQELTRITKAVEDGDFFQNPAFLKAVENAKTKGTALHLMGLLSDGGVHSHIDHLIALVRLAAQNGLDKVYVNAFLDGRDVPPRCAAEYIEKLEAAMAELHCGKIALISGRYYAMDRDNRWERVVKAYDALTLGEGLQAASALEALNAAYERGEDDEFVIPTVVGGQPIQDGDSLIFFNFRPDRARQLVRTFADPAFAGFERKAVRKDLTIINMTSYDATMPNVTVAFPPQSLKNTFGEYVASLGKTQLRIAETEKYAHVTFFFNGGVEAANAGEDRVLVASPKVATYDLQPEMSAYEVAEKTAAAILEKKYDFIVLNFANADMVGHTGSMDAAVGAINALDECVKTVVEALKTAGGNMILTADHGNAEVMFDSEGNIVTAHSTNPVPFLVLSEKCACRISESNLNVPSCDGLLEDGGVLADVIPTLLDLAGVPQPAEMTGHSLLVK